MAEITLSKVRSIFLQSTIGDALGTPLSGLKPEAVKAFYGQPETYIDPEKHLEKKIFKWVKPGYYSFLTQCNLLISDLLIAPGGFTPALQLELIECSKHSFEHFTGIFRNTPRSFSDGLQRLRDGFQPRPSKGVTQVDPPADFLSALAFPFFIRHSDNPGQAIMKLYETCLLFNRNALSAVCAAAVGTVFHNLLMENEKNQSSILAKSAESLLGHIDLLKRNFSADLDLLSLNGLENVARIIEHISEICCQKTKEEIYQVIVENAAQKSGQEITRPSHAYPLASVITAIYISTLDHLTPEEKILTAIHLGGDSGALGCITGALSALYNPEENIRENWISGLANRRQIQIRAENLFSGKSSGDTRNFKQMETDMTKSVSLDLERLLKKHPVKAENRKNDLPDRFIIKPLIPDRKNKRKWREFERQKSKEKRRRRD